MVCLGTGCDAVRASVYSHLGGVPMPVFGVAGYLLVAVLIIAESLVPGAGDRCPLCAGGRDGVWISLFAVPGISARLRDSRFLRVVRDLGFGDDGTLRSGHLQHRSSRPPAETHAKLALMRNYFAVCLAALVIGGPSFYELAVRGEALPHRHRPRVKPQRRNW